MLTLDTVAAETLRAPPGSSGHFQRHAVHPAGRSKKGSQCSRAWAGLRDCLTSHQEEEELTARSLLLRVVKFFRRHAHLQDVRSAHEGAKVPPKLAPLTF